MWRRSAFALGNSVRENQDIDQSISEEEEGFEDEWIGNPISLGAMGKNEAEVRVLSQLEILRDSYKRHEAGEFMSSHEDGEGSPLHDEIENPIFNDGGGSNCDLGISSSYQTFSKKHVVCFLSAASISHSDEESLYDDEKIRPPSSTNARNNSRVTCSEASREVEALVWPNGSSSCSLACAPYENEKKSCQGGGATAKSKPKFIFPHHASKECPSLIVRGDEGTVSDNILRFDEIVDEDKDKFIADLRHIFHQKGSQRPGDCIDLPGLAHEHHPKEQSVAALLDCFKQRSDMLLLGNLDDDDLPEEFDSRYPSLSGDEEKLQSLGANITRRTMGDQFHEAFRTVYVNDETQYSVYGKLQRVMQKEKERDKNYLRNIGAETRIKYERMCFFVRILSKFLEAKLIVCSCTYCGDEHFPGEENPRPEMKAAERSLSVIFNPRLCSNIELEVGNLICIHPPWYEFYNLNRSDFYMGCLFFSCNARRKTPISRPYYAFMIHICDDEMKFVFSI